MNRSKCKLHAYNKNSSVQMTSLASASFRCSSGLLLSKILQQICLVDQICSRKNVSELILENVVGLSNCFKHGVQAHWIMELFAITA